MSSTKGNLKNQSWGIDQVLLRDRALSNSEISLSTFGCNGLLFISVSASMRESLPPAVTELGISTSTLTIYFSGPVARRLYCPFRNHLNKEYLKTNIFSRSIVFEHGFFNTSSRRQLAFNCFLPISPFSWTLDINSMFTILQYPFLSSEATSTLSKTI